jgi:TonB family protein
MNNYISDNLIYPRDAKKSNTEGTVYISFVIEMDGSVDSVKVLKGVKEAPSLNNEAVRLVKKMKKWSWPSGMKDEKTRNQKYMIPIRFLLNDSNSSNQKKN